MSEKISDAKPVKPDTLQISHVGINTADGFDFVIHYSQGYEQEGKFVAVKSSSEAFSGDEAKEIAGPLYANAKGPLYTALKKRLKLV